MQLFIICNYVFIIFTTSHYPLKFTTIFVTMVQLQIAHPSTLTKLLNFSSKNMPLYKFSSKISCNLVTPRYIKHILTFIRGILRHLICIQGILNIYLLILWAY
jgi:hypothetical protein